MIPLVINCRDRCEPLTALLAWLERTGHERVILLDNDSAWPPLLELYETTPYEVVRLRENLGSQAPWRSGLIDQRFPGEPYAVTDPDIVPSEECPDDLLDHLAGLLERHPDRVKVGVGLRTDDLPARFAHAAEAVACESPYWKTEIEPGVFDAAVDTTMAVYRPGQPFAIGPAIRTGFPYVARHLSWYMDTSNPTPEERFYFERAASWAGATNWSGQQLPRFLKQWAHIHESGGKDIRSRAYLAEQRMRNEARRVRAKAAGLFR